MAGGRLVLGGGVDGEVVVGAAEVPVVAPVGNAVGSPVSVGTGVGRVAVGRVAVGVLDESGALDVSLEDDAGSDVPVVHALARVTAAHAAASATAPPVRRRLTRFGRSGRNSAPERSGADGDSGARVMWGVDSRYPTTQRGPGANRGKPQRRSDSQPAQWPRPSHLATAARAPRPVRSTTRTGHQRQPA